MNKAKLVLVICLMISLIALPLLASCAKPAPEKKTLKIGLAFSVSGPAAGWGKPISDMQLLIAEKINNEGGIKVGGETYLIEPILADTKFTPEGATAAAHKLVYGDKVKFMVGGFEGFESMSMQTITEKEKVILFCGAMDHKIMGPEQPYAYRIYLSPLETMPALFGWLVDHYPDVKKIAILNMDTESGRASEKNFVTINQTLGLEVVSVFFKYGEKDFTSLLSKVMAENVDVMAPQGDPATQALIVKQARGMGYKGLFCAAGPIDDKVLREIAGIEYAEGYISPVEIAPTGPFASPAAKELVQAYTDKYGDWNSIALGGGYPYTMPVFKAAIEATNSLDTEKVRAYIDSGVTFDTMLGRVTFGGEEVYGIGHQVLYNAFVAQMKDGNNVIVDKVLIEDIMADWALWPEELIPAKR